MARLLCWLGRHEWSVWAFPWQWRAVDPAGRYQARGCRRGCGTPWQWRDSMGYPTVPARVTEWRPR